MKNLKIFVPIIAIAGFTSIIVNATSCTTKEPTLKHANLNADLMYYEPTYDAVYYQFGTSPDPNEDWTMYNSPNVVDLEYDYNSTDYIEENFCWDSYEIAKNNYSLIRDFCALYDIQVTQEHYDSLLRGERIQIDGTGEIHKMDISMFVLDNHQEIHDKYNELVAVNN